MENCLLWRDLFVKGMEHCSGLLPVNKEAGGRGSKAKGEGEDFKCEDRTRGNNSFMTLMVFLIFSTLFLIPSVNAAIYTCSNCSECNEVIQNNASAGDIVRLTSNVSNQDGDCILINRSYLTFDCQNNILAGDNDFSGYGIQVLPDYESLTNVTITNCSVSQFYYGIRFYGSFSMHVENSSISNVNSSGNRGYGTYMYYSDNNTISNVISSYNDAYGTYLSNSHGNTLSGVTADRNNNNGIYLSSSRYNTLRNVNTSSNNNGRGIYLSSSSYNTISGGVMYNNTYDGIYCRSSSHNDISDIRSCDNGYTGVWFESSSNYNTLNNSQTSGNMGYYGVYFRSSAQYNNITNNNITLNYCGIAIESSSNNNLVQGNNISENTNNTGVFIQQSTGNQIIGNELMHQQHMNFGHAIMIYWYSSNTVIKNNYIANQPGTYCIYFHTQNTNSQIINNTLKSAYGGILSIDTDGLIIENNSILNITAQPIYLMSGSDNAFVYTNLIDSNASSRFGLCVRDSTGNTFLENTVSNNDRGIYIRSASSNTFISTRFNSNNYGVYVGEDSTNNFIIDSVMNNSNLSDIKLNTTSGFDVNNNTLVNVSFREDNATFECVAGSTCAFYKNWYLDAYVNYSDGSPVSNRSVEVYDKNNVLRGNESTNASGYTQMNVSECHRTGNETTYYSNYVATVRESGYSDSAGVNMSTNRVVYLTLPSFYSCSNCTDCSQKIQAANPGDIIVLDSDITGEDGNCIEFNGKDGVIFNCDHKTISGDGDLNGYGIYLPVNSNSNVITYCDNINGFGVGVYLEDSVDNTLGSISCIDNPVYGMLLEGTSQNNTVSNSFFERNSVYGIYLNSSGTNYVSNNLFYNNYLNNTLNLYSDTPNNRNTWNSTRNCSGLNIAGRNCTGGNLWLSPAGAGFSDNCSDIDGDGICETPYTAATNNIDYLPLSAPDDRPPQWSDNSTSGNSAGSSVEHRVKWTDNQGLAGYVFSWHNGVNWIQTNTTGDLEAGMQSFMGGTQAEIAAYNSTLGAPECSGAAGACIAPSSLLQCAGDDETNAPNTVDTCVDGITGTCHDSESVDNITIRSLNHSTVIVGGDTVEVTAWLYCWGSADDYNIVYANNANSPVWTIKNSGSCPSSGWLELKYNLTLDNVSGKHVVRVNNDYLSGAVVCAPSHYGDNDDLAFPVYASEVAELEADKTPVEYLNVLDGNLYEDVSSISVTAYVSSYSSAGSAANGNTHPTLWLEVYNGSTWVDCGDMHVHGTGNYTSTVTESTVLSGWGSDANRDVRISAHYMDYNSQTQYDEINWSGVWVVIGSEQEFINDSFVEMTGTVNWSNITKIINSEPYVTIRWMVYARDKSGNWYVTDTFNYSTGVLEFNLTATLSPAGAVTLNWSPIANASYYTIYFRDSYLPDAFNATEPNVTGLTDTNWTDSQASTVLHRYYKVGFVNASSNTTLSYGTVGKFDIGLSIGWNALSLGLNKPYLAESLLDEIEAQGGNCSEIDRWHFGGWSAHLHNVQANNFTISAGQGYYVKCSGSSVWTQASEIFHKPLSVNLSLGWNALSMPYSTSNYTAESLLDEIEAQGGDCTEIDRWHFGGWSAHLHNVQSNNFTISAGQGYYVKCSGSSVWTST